MISMSRKAPDNNILSGSGGVLSANYKFSQNGDEKSKDNALKATFDALNNSIRTRLNMQLYKIVITYEPICMEWVRLEKGFASTLNSLSLNPKRFASDLMNGFSKNPQSEEKIQLLSSAQRVAKTMDSIYGTEKTVGDQYLAKVNGKIMNSRPLQILFKVDSVSINLTNTLLQKDDIGWDTIEFNAISPETFMRKIIESYINMDD